METKMRSVSHGWKYVLVMETGYTSRLKQESVESVQLAIKLIKPSFQLDQSVLHVQQVLQEATAEEKMKIALPIQKFVKGLGKQRLMESVKNALLDNG